MSNLPAEQAGPEADRRAGGTDWPTSPTCTFTWRQRLLLGIACLLGLAVTSSGWWAFVPHVFLGGNNDFVMTYAGASLAGSGKLYDVDATLRVETPLGDSPQFLMYMRFPYCAALVSPLRRLSYRSAYWTWQAVSLAAVLVFAIFWPAPRRWMTALACCWSLPLVACFVMGQDITLVMAALAVSLALFFRGKPFAAGLVLSLCSIKFHLFLTLPLLILTRRWWRFGGGLAAGGAALLGISFLVEGWSWPVEWARVLRMPVLTPSYSLMPNLNGLVAGQPHAGLLIGAGACAVIAAAWAVMRAGEPTDAFAAMLIGGLLLSYHGFIADAAMLVPAGLLLIRNQTWRGYRMVGLVLLSSLAFLPFRSEHPPYRPAAILLLAFAAMAAIPAVPQWWRRVTAPQPSQSCQSID